MKTSTGLPLTLALVLISAICALGAVPADAHDMAAMGDGAGAATTGAMGQMGSHMEMGPHMVMTQSRLATPQDIDRARDILARLRASIRKYRNYKVALASGYVPFLPSVPQEVYHFVNYTDSYQENIGHFSVEHPGSLLYVKKDGGDYRLVGAMYSAPPDSAPAELDALVPLSIGTWHAHMNICLPEGITLEDLLRGNIGANRPFMPGMIPVARNARAEELNRRYGIFADGRFGFRGRISDEDTCRDNGGHFIKQAFGWMIHVYPFAGDDLAVAFGTNIPQAEASQ